MRKNDVKEFLRLEKWFAETQGKAFTPKENLDAFHKQERYKKLLEKVLNGFIAVEEPFAIQKKQEFLDELSTMGPAVYLCPWELTLKDLDDMF